ncbi:MAG: hypothetical protein WC530_09850 [Candidatus Omnitrophota bacterium]
MSNYLGDKSYLALKPQVDAGTPIIPTIHFPLVGENIRVSPNIAADRRMKGLDWKSDDVTKGARSIEGDFTVFGDPSVLGHVLNMIQAKGASTGSAGDGYTHPFTPGEGKHYTLEVPRGIYAERYFGVRGDSVELSFDEGRLLAKLMIKALGVWNGGSLAAALTGAGMTEAVLSTAYEVNPNKGLCVGDVLVIGATEVTLTSVDADGITVGFASTEITASAGDAVYLKAQTPSFGTQLEPFYLPNVRVGFGADETAATTAAGAEATATPLNEISIEIKNNLLSANQTGKRGTGALLNQVMEAQIKVKRLFENPDEWRQWIEGLGKAITIIASGKPINSDFTTRELLTLKFYMTKKIDSPNVLAVGGYVMTEQVIESLYDTATAKSLEITLVNRSAGTVY